MMELYEIKLLHALVRTLFENHIYKLESYLMIKLVDIKAFVMEKWLEISFSFIKKDYI